MVWLRRHSLDLLLAILLFAFVLGLTARLSLSNRILASGDAFLYFTPLRAYADSALRSGSLPEWNPYLFLGAPFLANAQAGVFYPPNWLLSVIHTAAPRAIVWSAVLHLWWAGLGAYVVARRVGGYGRGASFIAGVTLAGSGLLGGMFGHINQLNAAAWFPWAVLALHHASTHKSRRALAALGGCVGLSLLAGHAQAAFINGIGLGLIALTPFWRSLPTIIQGMQQKRRAGIWSIVLAPLGASARRVGLLAAGVILGGLLAAVQLAPTLALSEISLRAGGLDFREAASFSLRPWLLHLTFVPTYGLGQSLEERFGEPAFTEFVAYVGVVALVLAGLGAWRRPRAMHARELRYSSLILVIAGVLLALGAWNPLYWLLWRFAPGFDLFRAPARWMTLYTFGAAWLAAAGADIIFQRARQRLWGNLTRNLVQGTLSALIALELLLAARALPHYTDATALQALTSLRTAPAHLLTDPTRQEIAPGAMGRFLSLSGLTFDPGDLEDLRLLFGDVLEAQALDDLIVAAKLKEILAPNLPLYWRIPAVDGFDGGLLPLQRYSILQTLFVPPERLVPDGRLREQLDAIPPARYLDLVNVGYVITDKLLDLWVEDVYYDLQLAATVRPAEPLLVPVPDGFEVTALGLIGHIEGEATTGAIVAKIEVRGQEHTARVELAAGRHLDHADAGEDSPARAVHRDPHNQRWDYLTILSLEEPDIVQQIEIRALRADVPMVVRGLSLIDQRTGAFQSLTVPADGAWQRVHSGDVKVYHRQDALPRAYVTQRVQPVENAAEALERLRAPDFDPRRETIIAGAPGPLSGSEGIDAARIVRYEAEQIEIQVSAHAPGYLILSDAYAPGWTATRNGEAVPVYPANLIARAVYLPSGEHTVVMRYRTPGLTAGAGLSLLGITALIALGWPRRRR